MTPGRFVRAEWEGFEMQHRYEDLALIRALVSAVRPTTAVELGTARGGFAAMLAALLAGWGGRVLTVDRAQDRAILQQLHAAYGNLTCLEADVLAAPEPTVVHWLTRPANSPVFLYCDNGNKPREIELYAPILRRGSLLGCHDYSTEVPADWVEPFLAALGYSPYGHADFAALADPVNYPASLTRFWARR